MHSRTLSEPLSTGQSWGARRRQSIWSVSSLIYYGIADQHARSPSVRLALLRTQNIEMEGNLLYTSLGRPLRPHRWVHHVLARRDQPTLGPPLPDSDPKVGPRAAPNRTKREGECVVLPDESSLRLSSSRPEHALDDRSGRCMSGKNSASTGHQKLLSFPLVAPRLLSPS